MTVVRLARPCINEQELSEISSVLDSGYLTQGPKTEEFEQLVSRYLSVNNAIATTSATTALHLAMLALDIKVGDEIILPSFTFPATAHVVIQQGATPVLADIDLKTFNINIDSLKSKITERTKAVMPVHLFGLSADMASILEVTKPLEIPTVEDAACALGAKFKDDFCGTLGDLACFSFHPRKIITTGEGGMIVTNNVSYGRRVRRLRQHGGDRINNRFEFIEPGYNYRMSDINAAVGVAQMEKLSWIIGERRRLAVLYSNALKDMTGIMTPTEPNGSYHNYQAYVLLLADGINRDLIIKRMKEKGVETTIGTYALHAEKYIQTRYFYNDDDLPNALKAHHQALALPLYPGMNQGDVNTVVFALGSVL